MEKSILQNNQQPEKELILSNKAKGILKVIVDVNMLQGFRLDYHELCAWANDIERLAPELNKSDLIFLMDSFKRNDLVWDRNEGIQNIFKGLKLVYVIDGVRRIRKSIW